MTIRIKNLTNDNIKKKKIPYLWPHSRGHHTEIQNKRKKWGMLSWFHYGVCVSVDVHRHAKKKTAIRCINSHCVRTRTHKHKHTHKRQMWFSTEGWQLFCCSKHRCLDSSASWGRQVVAEQRGQGGRRGTEKEVSFICASTKHVLPRTQNNSACIDERDAGVSSLALDSRYRSIR